MASEGEPSPITTPPPLRSSLSRNSLSRSSTNKSVYFDEVATRVRPPPNAHAKSWFAKYTTPAAVNIAHRATCYGLHCNGVSQQYGLVAKWVGGGDESVIWCLCSSCCSNCLVAQQRALIERKLHKWHRERGAATGEADLSAFQPKCSLICCCLCDSRAVATHVAVMNTFKEVQGLVGGPEDSTPARPSPQAMQRAEEEEEEEKLMRCS